MYTNKLLCAICIDISKIRNIDIFIKINTVMLLGVSLHSNELFSKLGFSQFSNCTPKRQSSWITLIDFFTISCQLGRFISISSNIVILYYVVIFKKAIHNTII